MAKFKPRTGTVLTPALLKAIVEVTTQKAIETYQKEVEKHRVEARDRRFRDTETLMKKYLGFKEHSKGAVHNVIQISDDLEMEELVHMMKGYDEKYEAKVPSIMESVAITSTIVHHVDKMLDFYRRCCMVSKKPEDARRYRVVYYSYLAEPENQKDFKQIAEDERVDLSTVYKDHKLALQQLCALFFGYF